MKNIVKHLSAAASEIAKCINDSVWGRLSNKYLMYRYRKSTCPLEFSFNWSNKPNRIALVNLLVHDKLDGDYLEIGCDTNALFDSVPLLRKIGVDPLQGGTLRIESDDFFKKNEILFDVIFIDGLHEYEQVRRDVVNSMRFLKPGGWVGLHDVLPRNWVEEHVPRIGEGSWSGDVWKVAFELASTEGIDFRILNIDRGVGVFRVVRPEVELSDKIAELKEVRFPYLYENIAELPVIDWELGFQWIVNSKRNKEHKC